MANSKKEVIKGFLAKFVKKGKGKGGEKESMSEDKKEGKLGEKSEKSGPSSKYKNLKK